MPAIVTEAPPSVEPRAEWMAISVGPDPAPTITVPEWRDPSVKVRAPASANCRWDTWLGTSVPLSTPGTLVTAVNGVPSFAFAAACSTGFSVWVITSAADAVSDSDEIHSTVPPRGLTGSPVSCPRASAAHWRATSHRARRRVGGCPPALMGVDVVQCSAHLGQMRHLDDDDARDQGVIGPGMGPQANARP